MEPPWTQAPRVANMIIVRFDPPTPVPQRPSGFDRDAVVRRLQESCTQERLSVDGFAARVEDAYSASTRGQLDELVADLEHRRRLSGSAEALVARTSGWVAGLQAAWQAPRTPRLALPARAAVTLGRSKTCDCVLADPSVSRTHASIARLREGTWLLRDLRSTNGTRVNGSRLVEETEVRVGDRVSFGDASYRLAAPPG